MSARPINTPITRVNGRKEAFSIFFTHLLINSGANSSVSPFMRAIHPNIVTAARQSLVQTLWPKIDAIPITKLQNPQQNKLSSVSIKAKRRFRYFVFINRERQTATRESPQSSAK